MRNTAILGDYGSGKTLLIQTVAEKLSNSDRELVYINALDHSDVGEENHYKSWEDVLDVIVKLRFNFGVTVLDIGTLRKQYLRDKQGVLDSWIGFIASNNS